MLAVLNGSNQLRDVKFMIGTGPWKECLFTDLLGIACAKAKGNDDPLAFGPYGGMPRKTGTIIAESG